MLKRFWLGGLLLVLGIGCAAPATQKHLMANGKPVPEAVTKSFHSTFPSAQVEKLEAEDENGVMVYDFEFRDGSHEKECDIAADGTLLERTLVIGEGDVPAAAMNAIRQAADGATLKRIEQVEINYETKDGKVVKLPSQVTHYEVDMTKGSRKAEVVVTPDGRVVEPAKWQ